jgi:hypothetical protein
MQKYQTLRKGYFLFLVAALAVLISSCTEKISGVGSTYLRDTISSGIRTYSDSTIFSFQPVVRRTIIASGLNFNLNTNASSLFIGKVGNNDGIEAWPVLKIPIFIDSVVGQSFQVLSDTLVLKIRFPYLYGDSSNQIVDFNVYALVGTTVNPATDVLSRNDLAGGQLVGTYAGLIGADSLKTISIPLAGAILNPFLLTASLSLVLVPNPDMNTVRAFASNDNGDNTFSPTLKLFTQTTPGSAVDTSTKYLNPTYDFFVVVSDKAPQPNEFLTRGGYAERERIVIRIDSIRNQLKLNPFVTINSALLEVRSDSNYHTTSAFPIDTAGPSLAYIPNTSVADSGHTFVSFGTSATTDLSLYGFQIRNLVESALRNGEDSLILELRSGMAFRTISGSTVDVEDYNINRWEFYGFSYPDKTKRPQLIITYSYLR